MLFTKNLINNFKLIIYWEPEVSMFINSTKETNYSTLRKFKLIFKSFMVLFAVTILQSNNLLSKPQSQDEVYNKYLEIAQRIIKEANKDSLSYERLSILCDSFGHRLSGSEGLEKAIDWIYSEMKKDGFENVKKEEVFVPNWKRGTESLKMTSPKHKHLPMLSLGGSVATPENGITAEVFVVKNKAELFANKEKAKGKIVLFNFKFTNYGETVQYRFNGASWAAECGAVASIIRSVSPNDMNNPHTGVMGYIDSLPKIPHGAITSEDAELIERYVDRGVKVVLSMKISSKFEADALSHNVMGEIKGREFPNKVIALGGHIDSWDVGTGAQDDAGGCVATWEAVKLLKKLGLTPKHTIRAVSWTNEENGSKGGKEYAKVHKDEDHILLLESDSGIFQPQSIGVSGKEKDLEIMKSIEKLLKLTNPNFEVRKGGGGVDIGPMMELGYTGCGFDTDDMGKYFWYHHSETDTVDKINPKDLNDSIAAIAIAIYLYSELYY